MTTPINWASRAADKIANPNNAPIHGNGRWALVARIAGKLTDIYLYETESQARASAPFYDCKPIDLMPTPFPENCSNVHDGDADDRRRARQERQSACGN
jgi:hypothetical protein